MKLLFYELIITSTSVTASQFGHKKIYVNLFFDANHTSAINLGWFLMAISEEAC